MNSLHSINTSSGLFQRLCSGILRKNWAINTPSPPDLDPLVMLTVSRSADFSVFTDVYAQLMPPHVSAGVCVSYLCMNLAHLSFLHTSLHPEDVRVASCVIITTGLAHAFMYLSRNIFILPLMDVTLVDSFTLVTLNGSATF